MLQLKAVTLSALMGVFSTSLLAAPSPITDSQKETAEQLIQTALNSDMGYDIVTSLTTEVGPRLGGSEAEARARNWGAELGKELGFDRVSIEEFTMPFWDRGHLHITLTSPYQQPLYGTALGGAAPSESEVNADVVYFLSLIHI